MDTSPATREHVRVTAERRSVDVHTHFFPASLPDLAARTGDNRWPSLHVDGDGRARIMRGPNAFRAVAASCWDLDARQAEMDGIGIDVHVLSPVPVMLAAWAEPALAVEFCRAQNDLLAEAVASAPRRFLAFGAVPLPHVDAAITELQRLVGELGLAGIEIGAECAGVELDDIALRPFFAAAEALDVAVFVHPTDGAGAIRRSGAPYEFGLGMLTDTAMAAGALVFGGVLDDFPRLRIGLAHGCGTFAWALPRLTRGASLAPGARSAEHVGELVRRLWVDSLVFDPTYLPILFERFGADHVLLGSDHPFYPAPWGAATAILELGVEQGLCTQAQMDDVLWGNALRFLGPRVASTAMTSQPASPHAGGVRRSDDG
jgi:aminocarboxymuconate-semialdehyde decarboxylase